MKMTIELLENNQIRIELDEPSTFAQIGNLLGNAFVFSMNTALSTNNTQESKENIYDFSNQLFTSVLETFAPDKELRPDLDSEAILEAVNNKITNAVDDGSTTTN